MRRVIAGSLMTMWCVFGAVGAGQATDVTLYEVSEAVKLDPNNGGKFKSNSGTLSGWSEAGNVLCPQWIVDALDQTTDVKKVCGISIQATGNADDVTGIGPVSGTLTVLAQDKNTVDAPEIVVVSGRISGTIDMSPAFRDGRPLGSISGRFDVQGANGTIANGYQASGNFRGTFRLPFVLDGVGRPQYMMDNGSTVAIGTSEYVLRYPAVRLEVTLTPTPTTPTAQKTK